jgi:murein DD-endopeptidase MepM/ murein hydrolase activator NlpD
MQWMVGRRRVGLLETFGLSPVARGLRDAKRGIVGSPNSPRSQWDATSLRIFKPSISFPTWLGLVRDDRRAPIYNFFNREAQPSDEGYSVRVTLARDFRGHRFTYDGHLGTDFAVPVGSTIVASAPGRVVLVEQALDRGGLKVCVDHGRGLFTTSNHLSRSLVHEGKIVARGEPIGLSGASGMEFVLCFPWVAPHLHFNAWLNGVPVDPFAIPGETSLFRVRNDPRPHRGEAIAEAYEETRWDQDAVEAGIRACRDSRMRAELLDTHPLYKRAALLLVTRNYRSAAFAAFPSLVNETYVREPRLDLPLSAEEFDGCHLPRLR